MCNKLAVFMRHCLEKNFKKVENVLIDIGILCKFATESKPFYTGRLLNGIDKNYK